MPDRCKNGPFPVCRGTACVLSGVLAFGFLTGCELPARPPVVWAEDSSGFAWSAAEYIDVTSLRRTPIQVPDVVRKDVRLAAWSFHSRLKRPVFAACDWNGKKEQPARLSVWVSEGLTLPPKPLTFMVHLEEEHQSSLCLDIAQSPDGGHLLICTLSNAVIVDVKNSRAFPVAGIIPPFAFECLFNASPCVPNGDGFLALKPAVPQPDRPRSPSRPSVEGRLSQVHWDGRIDELAGQELTQKCFAVLGNPLADPFVIRNASWAGTTLSMTGTEGRIEIDAASRKVEAFPAESTAPATRPAGWGRLTAVPLHGGDVVLEVRERANGAGPTGRESFSVEVVVRQIATGVETVIDSSAEGSARLLGVRPFQLFPSPDRRWVFVSCGDDRDWKYGMLVDHHGAVVDVFGIERDEQKHRVKQSVIHPHAFRHPRFSDGIRMDGSRDQETELAKFARGPARDSTRFIEFVSTAGPLLFSDQGLAAVASFPQLRFLSCPDGFRSPGDLARLLNAAPNLNGISFKATNLDLAGMPSSDQLQVLMLESQPIRKLNNEAVPTLTSAGLLELGRFPNLRELFLRGRNGEAAVDYELSDLKRIVRLAIEHPATAVRLRSLNRMEALRGLRLHSAGIPLETLDEIRTAENLEELQIRGTVAGPVSLDFLRG
ncbi:MAG TPA: hypothetical protein VM452_19680 [Caulifigura sp.]|nr:hypothetical protein [Caulifigura sp.]